MPGKTHQNIQNSIRDQLEKLGFKQIKIPGLPTALNGYRPDLLLSRLTPAPREYLDLITPYKFSVELVIVEIVDSHFNGFPLKSELLEKIKTKCSASVFFHFAEAPSWGGQRNDLPKRPGTFNASGWDLIFLLATRNSIMLLKDFKATREHHNISRLFTREN